MEEVEREEEEEEGERGGGGGRGRGGREGRREHEGEGGGRRGGGGGREERRGVRFRCRVKLILCEDGGVCVGVGEGEMEQPSADRGKVHQALPPSLSLYNYTVNSSFFHHHLTKKTAKMSINYTLRVKSIISPQING